MARVRMITLSLATLAFLASAVPARAADPVLEVGTPLVGFVSQKAHEVRTTIFVVPGSSGAPVLGTPGGLYASIFIGRRLAVEPWVGFLVASSDGDSGHMLSFSGQASYFFSPASGKAIYAFGGAGLVNQTDEDTVPTYTAGVGYRIPVTDSLAVRIAGGYSGVKYTLFDEADWHHSIVVTFSIGGVFIRK